MAPWAILSGPTMVAWMRTAALPGRLLDEFERVAAGDDGARQAEEEARRETILGRGHVVAAETANTRPKPVTVTAAQKPQPLPYEQHSLPTSIPSIHDPGSARSQARIVAFSGLASNPVS
eukprot:scaffold37806_cov45-Prasinocladus_malaysianus.AAC.1